MRVGSTRKFSQDRTGFTMVELAVGLAIMGLLIGAILGSIQMVRGAKLKRQASDLEGLEAVATWTGLHSCRETRIPMDTWMPTPTCGPTWRGKAWYARPKGARMGPGIFSARIPPPTPSPTETETTSGSAFRLTRRKE